MSQTRRLAAIMFTDIAGYTALMQSDEAQALVMRKRHRAVFETLHKKCDGKILQYYGDGTLSLFESAIDATNCAVAIQRELQQAPVVPLRIGIHTGDIIYSEEEAIGDGVNVASRVESLATPGSVMISESVYKYIKNQQEIAVQPMGTFRFKNVEHPMEVFAVDLEGLSVPNPKHLKGKFTKHALPNPRFDTRRIPKSVRYVGGLILSVLLAMLIRSGFDEIVAARGDFQEKAELEKVQMPGIIQEGEVIRFLMSAFQYKGKDENQAWLSLGIPAALELEWDQDPHLSNVTFLEQDNVNLPFNEYLDIAQQGRLNYVLIGEYDFDESLGYQIKLTFYHVQNGKKAFEHEYTDQDIFSLLDKISYATKGHFGIDESYLEQFKDLPLEKYFTQSLDAFRLYSMGLSDYNFGNVKMITLLDSATTIDPGFAWAHYRLSDTHHRYQIAASEAKAHIKKAMEHRSRLPEKYASDIRILHFTLNNESEKALKLLEVKQEMNPNDPSVMDDLLFGYFQEERYEDLLSFIQNQQNIKHDPYFQLGLEVRAMMELGRSKAAIKKINSYLKAHSDELGMRKLLALCYYRAGEMESARSVYEGIELLEPEDRIATKMLESIKFQNDSAAFINHDFYKTFAGIYQIGHANMQTHLKAKPQALYAELGNFGEVPIFPYKSNAFVSAEDGDLFHLFSNKWGEFDRMQIKENGAYYLTYKIDDLMFEGMKLVKAQRYGQAMEKLSESIEIHPKHRFLKRYLKHCKLAISPEYDLIQQGFQDIAGTYTDGEDVFHIQLKDNRLIFHATTIPWLMAPALLFPIDDGSFIIENILGRQIKIIRKGTKVTSLDYVFDNGYKMRLKKK